MPTNDDRRHEIVMTGFVGIAANLALSAMKAVVGLSVGSISVTLDAVNNLVDALSSVITIVGTRLATKRADREHPMGHGRLEHLTALLLSVAVLYVGFQSARESVLAIWSGEVPRYDALTLALLLVGIVVKVGLSLHFVRTGRRLNSPPLVASGKDAAYDVMLSSGTAISAVVAMTLGVSIEPYAGLVIAGFILWSGYGMTREVIDDLIGLRVPRDTSQGIASVIASFDEVLGVYDLVIHSYGPESLVASARVAVSPSMGIMRFSMLEREVAEAVEERTGVRLVALGVCCDDTEMGEGSVAKSAYDIAESHDEVMQAHGFIEGNDGGPARLDIVVGFEEEHPESVADAVASEISDALGYDDVIVTIDRDVTDIP